MFSFVEIPNTAESVRKSDATVFEISSLLRISLGSNSDFIRFSDRWKVVY